MASLDTLHLTFVEGIVELYPWVVDQLLRLPAGHARKKIYQDVKTFLKFVLTQSDDVLSGSVPAVNVAAENALFDLYGPPEILADNGEYCWKTIEAEDRRRTEFCALVIDALAG